MVVKPVREPPQKEEIREKTDIGRNGYCLGLLGKILARASKSQASDRQFFIVPGFHAADSLSQLVHYGLNARPRGRLKD